MGRVHARACKLAVPLCVARSALSSSLHRTLKPPARAAPPPDLSFAAVAAAGTAGLFVLRAPPRFSPVFEGVAEELDAAALPALAAPPRSLGEHLSDAVVGARKALSLLWDVDMLLLLPIFFFSGAELAFWTGEFTQLLGGATQIGLVLSLSGVGEIVGGIALGRLSDRAGRTLSLLIAIALYSVGLWLAASVRLGNDVVTLKVGGSPVAAFVAAFLFGVADASFNANSYAMCSQLYGASAGAGSRESRAQSLLGFNERDGGLEEEEEDDGASAGGDDGDAAVRAAGTASVGAYTIFQLVQNAGSAVWYPITLYAPLHDTPAVPASPGVAPVAAVMGSWTQLYIQAGLLALTVVTFALVDLRGHARRTIVI